MGIPGTRSLVTWLRDAADFVIFYQRVEAAHAALRKPNCCHGPTDPAAFVGKYLELLVIRERIASRLEIGKKCALISFFVLIMAIWSDRLEVRGVSGGVGIRDITNLTQSLRSRLVISNC